MLLAASSLYAFTSNMPYRKTVQWRDSIGAYDGQVWRRQRRGRALSSAWTSSLVLACPIDDEAAAAARRRRRAPPNPYINQVAWTMDDNKVLPSCLTAMLRTLLYCQSP